MATNTFSAFYFESWIGLAVLFMMWSIVINVTVTWAFARQVTTVTDKGGPMKIDLTQPNPTIDAVDLGKTLGLELAAVIELMREGAITSRFETGVDEDAGTYRLTFWYEGTKARFTCDADGKVIKTSCVTANRPL